MAHSTYGAAFIKELTPPLINLYKLLKTTELTSQGMTRSPKELLGWDFFLLTRAIALKTNGAIEPLQVAFSADLDDFFSGNEYCWKNTQDHLEILLNAIEKKPDIYSAIESEATNVLAKHDLRCGSNFAEIWRRWLNRYVSIFFELGKESDQEIVAEVLLCIQQLGKENQLHASKEKLQIPSQVVQCESIKRNPVFAFYQRKCVLLVALEREVPKFASAIEEIEKKSWSPGEPRPNGRRSIGQFLVLIAASLSHRIGLLNADVQKDLCDLDALLTEKQILVVESCWRRTRRTPEGFFTEDFYSPNHHILSNNRKFIEKPSNTILNLLACFDEMNGSSLTSAWLTILRCYLDVLLADELLPISGSDDYDEQKLSAFFKKLRLPPKAEFAAISPVVNNDAIEIIASTWRWLSNAEKPMTEMKISLAEQDSFIAGDAWDFLRREVLILAANHCKKSNPDSIIERKLLDLSLGLGYPFELEEMSEIETDRDIDQSPAFEILSIYDNISKTNHSVFMRELDQQLALYFSEVSDTVSKTQGF